MNINEFNETVKSTKITVVKCGAEWCGPCKVLETKIDELEEKLPRG